MYAVIGKYLAVFWFLPWSLFVLPPVSGEILDRHRPCLPCPALPCLGRICVDVEGTLGVESYLCSKYETIGPTD